MRRWNSLTFPQVTAVGVDGIEVNILEVFEDGDHVLAFIGNLIVGTVDVVACEPVLNSLRLKSVPEWMVVGMRLVPIANERGKRVAFDRGV